MLFHTLNGYKIKSHNNSRITNYDLKPEAYIDNIINYNKKKNIYGFFYKYEEIKYLLFIKDFKRFDTEIEPYELEYLMLDTNEKIIVDTIRLPLLALKEYFLEKYSESIKLMKKAIRNEWDIGDKGYESYYSQAIQHYIYIAKIYFKQSKLNTGLEICKDVFEYIYEINKTALNRTIKIKTIKTTETKVKCDRVGIVLQVIPYQIMFSNLYTIKESEIFYKLLYDLKRIKTFEKDEEILTKWIILKNDLLNRQDINDIYNGFNFITSDIDKRFDTAKLSIIKSIIEISENYNYIHSKRLKNDLNEFVKINLKVAADNKIFLWTK